jgi:hypothetical protein
MASGQLSFTGLPEPHRYPTSVRLLLAPSLFLQQLLHGLGWAVASLTPTHCVGEERRKSSGS